MESGVSTARITEHLIKRGRKTFGFIGDIDYAKSNYERYEGFTKTLERFGLALSKECMLTRIHRRFLPIKREIDAFLDTLPAMPEAFVVRQRLCGLHPDAAAFKTGLQDS